MDNNQQSVTGIVSSASDKEREFYEELKKLTKKQIKRQILAKEHVILQAVKI